MEHPPRGQHARHHHREAIVKKCAAPVPIMTDRLTSALEVRHAYAIALDKHRSAAARAARDPHTSPLELGKFARAIHAAKLQYDAAQATVQMIEREGDMR